MKAMKRLRWLFLAVAIAASAGLAYASAYSEPCSTTENSKKDCERQRSPEWQLPFVLLLVVSGTGFIISWLNTDKR